MKKRILVMSGGVAIFMSFAIAGIALAAEVTGGAAMQGDSMMHKDKAPSSMMMMHPPAPMILSVTNEGMGRIRGVVASVNATSITVAGWGGVWTINTDSDTNVRPSGSLLSDIKVGDYVRFVQSMVMNNFSSSTLNRKFERIIFVTAVSVRK